MMTDIQKKNCLQFEGRCTKWGWAVMSYSIWWSVLQEVVCVKTPEPQKLAVVTKTQTCFYQCQHSSVGFLQPSLCCFLSVHSFLRTEMVLTSFSLWDKTHVAFSNMSEKRRSELAPDTSGGNPPFPSTHMHLVLKTKCSPSNTPLKLWGPANMVSIHNKVPTLLVKQAFCN